VAYAVVGISHTV